MYHNHTPLQSPFASLIHTNYIPDTQRRSEIIEFLNQPRQRVLNLNDQIAQLEAQLEVLKNERDSLQVHIDDHLAFLSPFRRLSEDIVREIFMHCRDTCPVRSTKDAPLLLTRVCQSWYRIAVETPRLWSAIHIHIPSLKEFARLSQNEPAMLGRRAQGIQRWLDRSGSLPVSFSLSVSRDSDYRRPNAPYVRFEEDYLEDVHVIVSVFLRYRSRWRAVRLHGVSAQIMAPLRAVQPGELPKLQSLRVGVALTGRVTELVDLNLDYILKHATSLHQLSLELTDLRQVNITTFPVRWGQMTELQLQSATVHSSSPPHILAILAAMSKTIQKFCCVMEVDASTPVDYSQSLGQRVIYLPTLNRLSLSFRRAYHDGPGMMPMLNAETFSNDTIDNILRMIQCPALEDLTFTILSGYGSDHISSLEHLIQQSGCNLKAFTTNLTLPESGFKDLLRLMPTVTFLKHFKMNWQFNGSQPWHYRADYSGSGPFHPLLQTLLSSTDSDSGVLCPILEHFHLAQIEPTNADPVVSWARARVGSGLRTLTLEFDGHTPAKYRQHVERLREEGLSVIWVYFGVDESVLMATWDRPSKGLQVLRGNADSENDWECMKWMPGSLYTSETILYNERFGQY